MLEIRNGWMVFFFFLLMLSRSTYSAWLTMSVQRQDALARRVRLKKFGEDAAYVYFLVARDL